MRTGIGPTERAYATIPTPRKMRIDTNRPIPTPEVIREAPGNPLQGLRTDHIGAGAKIAGSGLEATPTEKETDTKQ